MLSSVSDLAMELLMLFSFYILTYHILWQIRKGYTVHSSILKWLLTLLIDETSGISLFITK